MALFGEKYGDVVRVVTIGEESTELCGGTHVAASGDIGTFRILSETGVAAGVRRIEAVTGEPALVVTEDEHAALIELASTLKTSPDKVGDKVTQLQERNRQLTRELEKLQSQLSAQASGGLVDQAQDIDGVKVLTRQVEATDIKALRNLMDQLKQKLGQGAIVLASEHNGKAVLLAGVTAPLNSDLKAGELVNIVAAALGGKGGGRADMAQAGAATLDGLDDAFALVAPWVREKLAAAHS